MTWHDLDSARAEWLGAPKGDATLQHLLDVSRAEVVAYAPALPDPEVIPDGWRWAHLAHARNVWNAQNTNPSGSYGSADGGSFALTPFPLDWSIKARLRPTRLFGGVLA